MIKRSFDIIVSAAFLIVIFPAFFIIAAAAIKLSSPGPVFFRQKRTGLGGSVFTCYKFRSMRVNDECDRTQATANDSRVTKVGRVLRNTFIDELPQFYNVLKGDMSIIGPRPHMLYHTEMFSKITDNYHRRHDVRPGITGLAQVNGYIGETKTIEDITERVKYDLWYVENRSLALDVKIMLKSAVIFLKGLFARKEN